MRSVTLSRQPGGGAARWRVGVAVVALAAATSALLPSSAHAATGAVKGAGSGRCVDVAGSNSTSGVQLELWDCNGGSNQSLSTTSSNQLQVLGKCVDAYGDGRASGTKVVLWDCNGGRNQQWTWSNGTVRGVSSGLCLDASGAATANGTLLQLWSCNGGSNQSWSTPAGSPTTTPTPTPTTTTPSSAPSHFSTVAPTASLPSESQCAAWVRAIPIAEKRSDNTAKNNRTGRALTGASNLTSRVTGNFTGTTEQILRWAACKWGIDEDIVKAQAVQESNWHMSQLGDWGTDPSRCSPAHPLGADGRAGQCPESIGILQVRYAYHSVSFPEADTSTAQNADYAYAQWRNCYTGLNTWLTNGYAAGDAWGCVGAWFSGNFHDSAANDYISKVQTILNNRTWTGGNF